MVATTSVMMHEVMLSPQQPRLFLTLTAFPSQATLLCRVLTLGLRLIEAHIWNFTVNCGREKEGLMPAIKHTEPEVDMIISVPNLLFKTSYLSSPKDKEVSKCDPTMCPQRQSTDAHSCLCYYSDATLPLGLQPAYTTTVTINKRE